MADDTAAALYPPPPPFLRFFTDANVAKYRALLDDGKTADEISHMKDVRFLVPPKQPQGETYRSFGDLWWFQDKSVSLTESGITQLYEDDEQESQSKSQNLLSPKRIEQLKKLTQSLLLNYLELVGIFAKNPTLVQTKIGEIRTILINIHHLLNSYRLHQSREAMILNYQQKVQKTLSDVNEINETCEKITKKLDELQKVAQVKLQESQSYDNSDFEMGGVHQSNTRHLQDNENVASFRSEAIEALLSK